MTIVYVHLTQSRLFANHCQIQLLLQKRVPRIHLALNITSIRLVHNKYFKIRREFIWSRRSSLRMRCSSEYTVMDNKCTDYVDRGILIFHVLGLRISSWLTNLICFTFLHSHAMEGERRLKFMQMARSSQEFTPPKLHLTGDKTNGLCQRHCESQRVKRWTAPLPMSDEV